LSRHQEREREGAGGVAEIDRGDGEGVAAQAEKRALAEAEDAADPPDEGQAERIDRQHHVERHLHDLKRVGIDRERDHQQDAEKRRGDGAENAGAVHQRLRRKNLPVMP
jgi:hypothetical protein